MRLKDLFARPFSGDHGASAVLVAASLFLLMGMAAIAVDAGIGYSDRRQQASAADVGALAAVQFAKTTLPTSHPDCTGLSGKERAACRGAEEVLDVVDGTLPGRYADLEWENCQDPNKPAEYTSAQGGIASAISECISFTSDLRRSRVVLPGTDVETAFGKAIGFNTIHVGAFAEAGLEMTISGGVLPFALGPSGAGSDQACFFSGDNPILDTEPCKKNTQGNFGKLDVRWYGNELYNQPTPYCTGQNAWRMSMNIITGTDHPLEIHTKDPLTIVNDVSNCDIITTSVDEVQTWTGNAAGAIADGLIGGVTSPTYEGRLLCKDGSGAEDYPAFDYTSTGSLDPCVQVNNNHPGPMDHTPLWEFRAWTNGACNGSINDRAGMEACIAHYKATNPTDMNGDPIPLFTDGIADSPRFGGVPELNLDPGNGTGAYLITGFTPVYLETMYYKCTANSCDIVHSPGENTDLLPPAACPTPLTPGISSCGWLGNGNKNIEAITAFILTLDMLPGDLAEDFPYQPGTIVYNLYR